MIAVADFHVAELSLVRTAEALRGEGMRIHEERVGLLCGLLCKALGLDLQFAEPLKIAAEFHDIGKLTVSDTILHKADPLSDHEWDAIRAHCQNGHDILRSSDRPEVKLAATVALTHHEYFDGSGYPRGLKGADIPFGSRIVNLCDVYDALRSPRSYRGAISHAQAVSIITMGDGRTRPSMFDPTVLEAFIRCAKELAGAYESD